MAELPVLSPTDISVRDSLWECEPLTVETVLEEGEHLVYYVARTLRYLSG